MTNRENFLSLLRRQGYERDVYKRQVLGVKSDGTVVAAGSNGSNQLDTEGWTHVVSVSAGDLTSFGIQENGKVESAGYGIGGLTYVKAKSPIGLLKFWYSALKW